MRGLCQRVICRKRVDQLPIQGVRSGTADMRGSQTVEIQARCRAESADLSVQVQFVLSSGVFTRLRLGCLAPFR
jgi:hypothetical protein